MSRANVRPGRWAFQIGDVKMPRSTLVKTWGLVCKSGAGKIYAHANGFPRCSTTKTRDGVKGKHVETLRELLELANVAKSIPFAVRCVHFKDARKRNARSID